MYIFPKIYFATACLLLHNKLLHTKSLGDLFPKTHLIQTLAKSIYIFKQNENSIRSSHIESFQCPKALLIFLKPISMSYQKWQFEVEKLSFEIPQLLKLPGTAKKCQNYKIYDILIKQLLDPQLLHYSLPIMYLEKNMNLIRRKEKESYFKFSQEERCQK